MHFKIKLMHTFSIRLRVLSDNASPRMRIGQGKGKFNNFISANYTFLHYFFDN